MLPERNTVFIIEMLMQNNFKHYTITGACLIVTSEGFILTHVDSRVY